MRPKSPNSRAGVEIDDAYLGGQRLGASAAAVRPGQVPVALAAVETTARAQAPGRPLLTVVKGFRKKEIATLAKRDLAAGSNVVTNGLSWTAVSEAGCDHFPMVTGSGPKAARWVPFTSVNTALGNIKTALRRHLPSRQRQARPALSDMTSFAWRFNRRYQLDTLTERLAYACARTPAHPYRVIITG